MRYKSIKYDLLVILLFTFLSLLYTYPLILSFKSTILGVYYDDPQGHLWNMWWTKESALTGNIPFFTDYILYPLGAELSFNANAWAKNFLSIPLQTLFGLIPAYNILILSTFVLSGFGAYKLADYLIQNKPVSIIAGIIYAFCSYRMLKIFLLNCLSTEWIPFYIYFLSRSMIENHSLSSFSAGIFLTLSFYDHPYYAVFLLIFTVIFSLYFLLLKSFYLKGLIIILTLFFILCLPLVIPMLKQVENNPIMSLNDITYLSFDILSPICPYYTYPIKIFRDISYKLHSYTAHSTFIGFIPLILMIYSVKYFKGNSIVVFWWVAAIIFFVLSLGPYLKIAGNFNFPIGKTSFKIPMPYQFLYYSNIPGMSMIRAPERAAAIIMIFVSILSAYGLKYIYNTLQNTNRVAAVTFISCIFIGVIFESFKISFPFQSREYVHPFYYQLAREKDKFSIVDIPFGIYSSNKHIGKRFSNTMYYQTIHNKPIFNGLVSYMPTENIDYFERLPFFSSIIKLQNENPIHDISNNDRVKILYLFNLLNIKYIIIHNVHPLYAIEDGITIEAIKKIDRYIKSNLPVTEVWSEVEKEAMIVYEKQKIVHDLTTKNKFLDFLKGSYEILSDNQVYKIYQVDLNPKMKGVLFDSEGLFSNIHLVSGWSELERDSEGVSFRWADKENSLLLFEIDNEKSNKVITFKAKPFIFPDVPLQEMEIHINDKLLLNYKFESSLWEDFKISIPSKHLKKGVNFIKFSYTYNESPEKRLGTSDERTLSVAFSNINIKEVNGYQ